MHHRRQHDLCSCSRQTRSSQQSYLHIIQHNRSIFLAHCKDLSVRLPAQGGHFVVCTPPSDLIISDVVAFEAMKKVLTRSSWSEGPQDGRCTRQKVDIEMHARAGTNSCVELQVQLIGWRDLHINLKNTCSMTILHGVANHALQVSYAGFGRFTVATPQKNSS